MLSIKRDNTMTFDESTFYSRLRTAPSFLFLGQRYLALETAIDPLLADLIRKYGTSPGKRKGYFSIFTGEAGDGGDATLSWINERSKRLSEPDWFATVREFPWSGLYTSAIDAYLVPAFRTAWRDIQPIFEEKYSPSDPRNRRVLHATHLFGSVNQTDEASRPPLRHFDWSKRKQVAVSLARRLPELVTPLGLLLIEGYSENDDWFSPDELLPILDSFAPGQVHIFSASNEFMQDADVLDLRAAGKLTFHSSSLAALLVRGTGLGMLKLGPSDSDGSGAKRLFIAQDSREIPNELWTQVTRSASIVDDSIFRVPPPLSDDARYREFRAFLGGIEGRLQWVGVQRGFAFKRDFESVLRNELSHKLAKDAFLSEPVIIHGQSGTGKSIAMVSTALSLANEKQYPILHIERRTLKPVYADIDRFCKWAEDNGAQASLLLWDGMLDPDEYSDFLRVVRARGRKIVLAGTCYHLETKRARSLKAIEAPAKLSIHEKSRFVEFLRDFHPSLATAIERSHESLDESFLVALYRILPPTRALIRTGLSAEAGFYEELIARNATSAVSQPAGMTLLELELRKAGLVDDVPKFSTIERTIGSESISEVQEFTGLVMVPGRFGLRIPLELLLRTLSKPSSGQVVRLFEGVDIFRWYEDSVGNIDLGPRNPLEAELIVMARLGGPHTEIEYAKRLIFNVKDSGEFGDGREVTFAVELLYSIGPQGDHGNYFEPYFKDLADTLGDLRRQRDIQNPRLMLQEANLLREWAVLRDRQESSDSRIDDALATAEQVVRSAIELLPNNRSRKLRNSLFNELTATLATRASRHTSDPLRVKQYFAEAQAALRQARLQDPDSYYPVDILAWFAKNIIKADILDSLARNELLADVLAAFQTAESFELDTGQQVRFQSRRMEIGALVNWRDIEEDAFTALEASGSTAGYYLRALRASGLHDSANTAPGDRLSYLEDAFKYLHAHYDRIKGDARCLDLLFDLWWMIHSGSRLFSGERIPLPFSNENWVEGLAMIEAIERTGETQRPLTIAYLRGICLFHLGSIEMAHQTFVELDRESERIMGRRRIIRSYLASTPQGLPRLFHGTVAWVDDQGNKGKVHVEELRRLLDFRPRDFGKAEVQAGSSLGEFHVAFNFVGPIADPTTFFKR